MRISEFFNDFSQGKIDPQSSIPIPAIELYDMLSEYMASIKMHRSTLNENETLKKEVKVLEWSLQRIDKKLNDALEAEKIQRQRAFQAEKQVEKIDNRFHYNKGDIYNALN